ncbi:MAG: DJ-1/PfpI family protein [Erysipelotrichaceae bacterium]|nr:DJ-1/PfpI family protein [Erysipelotrichaceae bacterium]
MMKVGILCAPGMEECEGLIVYDLLFRAGIEVKLIGLEKEITSSHNLTFKTDLLIDEFDGKEYDCVVLPGGLPGTKNLEADTRVQNIIDEFVKEDKYIAAICAAPSILNHKGLLKDEKFTCFPGWECELKSSGQKAVKEGKIITGKGLGATFEFAYEIIKALDSEEKAQSVLKTIQY